MMGLTPRQADALRFITGYCEVHDRPPTLTEIAGGLGLGMKPRAHYIVAGLIERKAVRRDRKRQIEVLRALPIPRTPDGAPLYFVRFPQ